MAVCEDRDVIRWLCERSYCGLSDVRFKGGCISTGLLGGEIMKLMIKFIVDGEKSC
jgi:hypothetical protein